MKKIIICLVLAMLFSTGILAAEVETYVNYDTREVAVSGTIAQAAFNRMVSVIVSDAQKQYYVDTVGTQADGSYSLTFRMPESAETGVYRIAVNALGMEAEIQQEFYFAKKTDIDEILTLINHGAGVPEIKTAVEENIAVLNIPRSWYDSLDSAGKTAIAEALYKARPYAAISDATSAAYNELAVQAFRCAASGEKIASALHTFAAVFNINKDTAVCYELYNSFGHQTEAHEIMAGYSCEDVQDVIKAYNEATLLAAVNKAGDPSKIKRLIQEYRAVIPFSLDVYDKSDVQKTVTYLYQQGTLRTMSALEAAVEAAYKQQQDKGQSGGNRGGGGGGGSFVNLPPSVTAPPEQATPAPSEPDTQSAFDDLEGAAWAKEAIEYLAERKIVAGTGAGKFEPDQPVTREQFVMMVMNAFSMNDPAAVCAFRDMPDTHWAYQAVASACQREIIFGINDGEFGTGREIIRQDMAVIAYRAAQQAGHNFEHTSQLAFADAGDIAGYAKESVAAMSAGGILNGYADARFAPADTATRAQAAKILYEMIIRERNA